MGPASCGLTDQAQIHGRQSEGEAGEPLHEARHRGADQDLSESQSIPAVRASNPCGAR